MNALGSLRRAASGLLHRHLPALGRAYRRLADRRWQSRPVHIDGVRVYATRLAKVGDLELRAALLREMQQADVFVDVGANVGIYACLAANTGKPVLAIEPQRQNLSVLSRNIALNNLDRIEVLPVGLSDRPGSATLYGLGDVASLDAEWNATGASYEEVVNLSTLDLVLAERFAGAQLLIKIDVEGFEFQVLRGAALTLARVPRPIWLVEIFRNRPATQKPNDNFEATFSLFASGGYQTTQIDESNFLFRTTAR